MNIWKNVNGLLMALGVVVVFGVGAFFALGVRSVFTDTASAQLTAPNPGHTYDQIGLPEGTWTDLDADMVDNLHAADIVTAGAGVCYTNWNSADCAAGFIAVSLGEWTAWVAGEPGTAAPTGGGLLCAAPKNEDPGVLAVWSATDSDNDRHLVNHEPCAICCK